MGSKAVGIDLGTTNSAVAWIDATGRSAMVTGTSGELLTPSAVLFEDDEIVVGREARDASITNPDRVAQWVKREMGSPFYSHRIRGEQFPPEVIQACILRRLKDDITEMLGTQTSVVITVPAYFDETRRSATAAAADMAGLDVLDIVNEPTAAALAFGETLGYVAASGKVRREMTILVYDLGGGTFDVTVLRLEPRHIMTLATDGDVRLGGYDWDMRLVEHAATMLERSLGMDLREDPGGFNRLYHAVVDAKHTLSARQKATLRIAWKGRSSDLVVTRRQFAAMTADLLERTSHTTRQVLADAQLNWSAIDRVLLVGGSSRMPMVTEMLMGLGAKEPSKNVNPDEAVARGAALYANYLLSRREAAPGTEPDFVITNVNSHSLGLEGIDPKTSEHVNRIIIPKNTPLPAKHTKKFVTKAAGQKSVVIQVLEGESRDLHACIPIGQTILQGLPPGLAAGHPIRVTFRYRTNGMLSVDAEVPGTGAAVTLTLQRDHGLDRQEISRWRQALAKDGSFSALESVIDTADPPASSPEVRQPERIPSGPVERDAVELSSDVDDETDEILALAMAEARESHLRRPARRRGGKQQRPPEGS